MIPQAALEANLPSNEAELNLKQIDAIIEKYVTILDPVTFKTNSDDPRVGMVYALSVRNLCDFEIKFR